MMSLGKSPNKTRIIASAAVIATLVGCMSINKTMDADAVEHAGEQSAKLATTDKKTFKYDLQSATCSFEADGSNRF